MEAILPLSFSDFPEDVLLFILSFLRPIELEALASTSTLFFTLCHDDQRLWFSMCDRRWGSQTQLTRWGSGKISYKHLYRFLDEYENLIGFWCSYAGASTSSPPLVFFEWGPFYLTGSRISPSKNRGYGVIKKPFLWMSVTSNGEPLSYIDFNGKFSLTEGGMIGSELELLEGEFIQVNVSFLRKYHLVVEENSMGFNRFSSSEILKGEECENVFGSPPDRLLYEIFQYFANKREREREKEKHGRMRTRKHLLAKIGKFLLRKREPEHFVKIVFSPKPSRPLQGLWKGICEDSSLDFYMVSYDDNIGSISCRKIGDSSIIPLTFQASAIWTSSTTFIESPFSPEEDHIYNCRLHLHPAVEADQSYEYSPLSDGKAVSRMLYMNSSFDLLVPDLDANAANSQQVDGRIWQYENGTFGFGFLRDSYIIDLKHVAKNGQLLDTIYPSNCRYVIHSSSVG